MDFDEKAILSITRPKDSLLTYYILMALTSLVAAPFMGLYLYFRYHTMRYRFDSEGISKSWGILFHHEIVLNYSRIQDIHLQSNFIERLLGLARIEIQTASGGGGEEMSIEGMENVEQIRDYLYSKMRGAKTPVRHQQQPQQQPQQPASELAAVMHEIAGELRRIRKELESRSA
jgi:putative membrane protein